MGKIKIGIIVLTSIALVGLVGAALVSKAAPEPIARKIVVFQSGVNEATKETLVKNFGGEKIKDLPLVNGMAVLLSPKATEALSRQAEVLRIDNDDVVFAFAKPSLCGNGELDPGEKCEVGYSCPEGQVCENCKCVTPEEPTPPPPPPAQEIAWGVDRINADLAWATSTGAGVKVAILDTGIDIDHPDLSVAGGVNVLLPFRTDKYNDDNGHGTHVAGIVAALNNEIGVVGVAPNAELYAVKAFNRSAIGFDSDIIDGIDWCITNGMQVINMSFGGGDNTSLHQAIQAVYNAGIVMVAAAGNNGTTDGKIVYPAKYSETIAVSATTIEDQLASFSSYATDLAQVETVNLIAAPGKDINSTWNDGYYYVGSGTSMATPHVVGTVALVLKAKCPTLEDGTVVNCISPAKMITHLESTAEDLGATGTDIYFGYGLVDAENAVIQ